jgi:hypothetical protein
LGIPVSIGDIESFEDDEKVLRTLRKLYELTVYQLEGTLPSNSPTKRFTGFPDAQVIVLLYITIRGREVQARV